MNCSLSEVQALAAKAARGSGYDWGLADEAGVAVRWLCAAGLDGCGALAGLLGSLAESPDDGKTFGSGTPGPPGVADSAWVSETGRLCPIRAGAALSDFAFLLGRRGLTMTAVAWPLLLLPFVSAASRQLQTPLDVTWDRSNCCIDGHDVRGLRAGDGVNPPTAARVRVHPGRGLGQAWVRRSRTEPDAGDWEILYRFAARTYAPATEESRILGAGAGLIDSD